jgi:hypothetical protein
MRTSKAACTSCFVFLMAACGGGAPPPDSPESVSAEGASTALADTNSEAAQPAAGEEQKAPSGAPASEQDVSAILQLVVDDPELDSHLHLGEPGRFPLKIAGEGLPAGLKLVKATEQVVVAEPPKSKKDAVLVFTEIDVRGERATVRYRYDVEGIRATVTLAKTPHGWELRNSRLVEH